MKRTVRCEPLSNKEKAWIMQVEKLLLNPPSDRLGLYTVGDACLGVFDSRFEDAIHKVLESSNSDFPQVVGTLGVDLGQIRSCKNIHSVAG